MRKLILAGALLLGACTTTPATDTVGAALATAITAEVATQFHCPASASEVGVLVATRLAFDILYTSRLTQAQLDALYAVRHATDEACSISAGAVAA